MFDDLNAFVEWRKNRNDGAVKERATLIAMYQFNVFTDDDLEEIESEYFFDYGRLIEEILCNAQKYKAEDREFNLNVLFYWCATSFLERIWDQESGKLPNNAYSIAHSYDSSPIQAFRTIEVDSGEAMEAETVQQAFQALHDDFNERSAFEKLVDRTGAARFDSSRGVHRWKDSN